MSMLKQISYSLVHINLILSALKKIFLSFSFLSRAIKFFYIFSFVYIAILTNSIITLVNLT